MQRAEVKNAFDVAATDGVLLSPRVAGLSVLCESIGVHVHSNDEIENYILSIGRDVSENWNETEFIALLIHLGWSDKDKDELEAEIESASQVVEAQVMAQSAAKEQFEVKPSQVLHAALSQDSSDVLLLMEEMQFEHAMVASKHEAMFSEFMALNPCDDEVSPAVRRARDSRQFYYFNLRRMIQEQMLKTRAMPRHKIFDKFVPVVSPFTPDGNVKGDAQVLVDSVVAADIPIFERLFFERWGTVAKNVQYCEVPLEDVFAKFVQTAYFPILREAISKRSCVFVPKFPPDLGDVALDVQKNRKTMIASMNEELAQVLERELPDQSQAHMASMPSYQREFLTEESFALFGQDNYFECMAVLAMTPQLKTKFVYEPPLQPRDAEERMLVGKVTSLQANEIDYCITQRWNAELQEASVYVQKSLPPVPPSSFLDKYFYEVLRFVIGQSSEDETNTNSDISHTSSSSHLSGQQCTSDQIMEQMFASSHVARPRLSNSTEAFYVGAMQLLTKEFGPEDFVNFEGFITTMIVKSRTASPARQNTSHRKRGVDTTMETKVVDVVAVDRTGPACICIWGDLATTLEALMAEFTRKNPPETNKKPILLLENMRPLAVTFNKWNGTIVTPMKILQTVRGGVGVAASRLSFAEVAKSPFMTSETFRIPPPSVMMTRFSELLQTETPFRVSLKGVIFDAGPLESSMQGNPKKSFKLVDEIGCWLSCVAIGEQATKSAIAEHMEVLLFFASGRGSSSSSEGAIFLFQSSCIMAIGKVRERIALQRQVEIV